MKVDLDGLARNIKADLDVTRRRRSALMVDEMVRHIKKLEAIVEPLNELRQHRGAQVTMFGDIPPVEPGDYFRAMDGPGGCAVEVVNNWPSDSTLRVYKGTNLAEALKAAVEAKRTREAEAKEGT